MLSIQDILKTHLPGSLILPDNVFANALQTFVEKHENDAIEDFVNLTLSNIQKELYNNKKEDFDEIKEFVLNKTSEANENIANIQMDPQSIAANLNKPVIKSRAKKVKKEDLDDDESETIVKNVKPVVRGRKSKKVVDSEDDVVESEIEEIESVSDIEILDNKIKKRKQPEIDSDSDSTLKKKPKVVRKKAEPQIANGPVRTAASKVKNESIDLTEIEEKPAALNQRKLPFSIVAATLKKK